MSRNSWALLLCVALLLPLLALGYSLPSEPEISADPTLLFACFDHNFAQVRDYTSLFLKKEVLDGKVYPEEQIRVSYMRPQRIKLEWLDGESAGMWAIYDKGRDPEHFWAKDVSWRAVIGVQRYSIQSKFTQLFHPNRFVITDSDIGSLVRIIRHFCTLAGSLGTLDAQYRGRVRAPGTAREAFFIHAFLYPRPDPRFMAREADVYLSVDDCMPINVTLYGWDDAMIGRYVQRELRFNVGLTEQDFALPE